MKQRGSKIEFMAERDYELLRTYRRVISGKSRIDLGEVAREVVASGSSRFWVSEERARAVVSAMRKRRPVLEGMQASKRAMYEELYRRVEALLTARPGATLSEVVTEAVNGPAPGFYMEPRSAIETLYKLRKRRNG